ncbi:MAG: DnaJ domain-containing protein [Leptospiraceae bacterium]|nr:DnaJ domain-containing protein [Leptospiraceae bacterium]
MDNFEKYCSILGVRAGDSADDVKKAFRSRIKKYHPDTADTPQDAARAQLLIEAYSAFKKGVPARPAYEEGGYRVYTKQAPPQSRNGTAYHPRPGAAYSSGRHAGKRIFDEIFRERKAAFDRGEPLNDRPFPGGNPFEQEGPLGNLWRNLADFLYADAEEEEEPVYGDRVHAHRRGPARTEPIYRVRPDAFHGGRHPHDASREFYARAEDKLRAVVESFERRNGKFRGSWIKEYIGNLSQVQVLYRDVARRFPHLSVRALQRVRQINELITEIKKSRV